MVAAEPYSSACNQTELSADALPDLILAAERPDDR
jgi:hypothetical protein